MSSLENVYCLGCKTRHEKVEIQAIKKMTVRNSTRYQAYGICPEGKKWTKIMKKDSIPDGVPIEDHTISRQEKETVEPEAPVSEDEVVVVEPMAIFQKVREEAVSVESEPTPEPEPELQTVEVEVTDMEGEDEGEEEKVELIEPQETVVPEIEIPIYSDEEEEGGEILQLNHVHPRPQRRVEKRQPMRPMPPPMIREPPREDLVEKAYSMGERMGFLTAQETGVEFIDHFEASLSRTRIPQEYHQYFYEGYLEGGTEFLDRMMAEQLSSPQEQSVENKADLKPTTVAGIAGLGIFGAWLASRIKGGNN